jgi:hypothetical protein
LTYQIARDGQEFGPYSLSDVQRYLGTGNILLSDFARAEGSTEWIPVAQIVGALTPAQTPSAYAPMSNYPPAPDMNWGIVLLLDIVTCGLFNIAWNLVQAFWIKKVQPDTKALLFYWLVLALAVVNIAFSVARMVAVFSGGTAAKHTMLTLLWISAPFTIASLLMQWIVYPFAARESLLRHFNESDPVGLRLSGVMTFFFGSLYFQYHLNRINELKRGYQR